MKSITDPAPPGQARDRLVGLQQQGMRKGQVRLWLAEQADNDPAIQRAWHDWSEVTDREELRLRLEVLTQVRSLDPELAPFITFCFRASVADLYQPAAIVLGRHLHAVPALRDYLEEYSKRRQVNLDSLLAFQGKLLHGKRTHRRLLLVSAAAQESAAVETDSAASAIAALARDLPDNTQDWAVVLLAMHAMLERQVAPEAFADSLGSLIEGVTVAPEPALSRTVIQRCCTLLPYLPPEQASRAWQKLLARTVQRIADASSQPCGHQGALLMQLDEVLRALAFLPESSRRTLIPAITETEYPQLAGWMQARLRCLLARESVQWPTDLELDVAALMEQYPEPVVNTARQFMSLLEEMASSARWLSHSVGERARMAVLMIDYVRHAALIDGGMDEARMDAILERFDIQVAEHAPGTSRAPLHAASGILLKLLAWEGAAIEALIDARMLHGIDDLRVLLALVPVRRPTPLAASLADALEQQMRWRLRTEPDFDPALLLRKLSVRRPHPGLLHALVQLADDRRYLRADGTPVDLQAMLKQAATDADTVGRQGGSRPGVTLSEDLQELLDRVSVGQHRGDGDSLGLMTLLGRMYRSDQPVLTAGEPAWSKMSYGQLADQVTDICASLHRRLSRLLPAHWADDDTLASLRDAEHELQSLKQLLVPVLPLSEANWLEARSDHLLQLLDQRRSQTEQLFATWSLTRVMPSELDTSLASQAVHSITRVAEPESQSHLLGLFLDALVARAGRLNHSEHEDWASRRAILDWSLLVEVPGAQINRWHSLQQQCWADLVRQAMTQQHQGRALALMLQADYESLQASEIGQRVMSDALPWCYDRLRLGAALGIRRRLRVGRISGVAAEAAALPLYAGELGRFFIHYSAVWLAMLIGCILMLDFGDAWKSMAEIGDVRGIAITFVLGVGGTYLYLLKNLRDKGAVLPDESTAMVWRSRLLRAGLFLMVCLAYTLLMTTLLWLLLSSTDEVVHGPEAIGHIVVWAGFGLFMGVFFGLIAGDGGS